MGHDLSASSASDPQDGNLSVRRSPALSLELVLAKLGLHPRTLFPQPHTRSRELELLEANAGNEDLCFFTNQPHNLGQLPAQLGLSLLSSVQWVRLTLLPRETSTPSE